MSSPHEIVSLVDYAERLGLVLERFPTAQIVAPNRVIASVYHSVIIEVAGYSVWRRSNCVEQERRSICPGFGSAI
jgi:hypothetical protein